MKKFNFEIDGSKYEVSIKSTEGDIADIEVNGTPYSVKTEREEKKAKTPTLTRPAVSNRDASTAADEKTSTTGGASKPGSKSIKSPLPGNILKINVSVGDSFKDGDTLMVMESMKMENNILAENNGTITKVNVSVGKAVLQDEVLLEYE